MPVRDHPARAQDHDAVAQRGDFLHDVRREEQAPARAAQRAKLVAQRAHAHDVEAVGRLVEQDRRRIVHERARDRDLHALALRESLRAPIGERARARASRSARRRAHSSAAPDKTVQRAVVADVLARGQARVQPARVRQHADALAHREAVAQDVEVARRFAVPASGVTSVASMRSSVVLPAPFGPSRPVISPSGAMNETSSHRAHFALLAERLAEPFDADHGDGARRFGNNGGGTLFSKCDDAGRCEPCDARVLDERGDEARPAGVRTRRCGRSRARRCGGCSERSFATSAP